MIITRLQCGYMTDPLGVDTEYPRFSWILEDETRDQKQTAYQVLVSTSPSLDSDLIWDSGKVESAQTNGICYQGEALQSDSTYYWKVRSWDRDDSEVPFSEAVSFHTGLFKKDDWQGSWISGDHFSRKEFTLPGKPVRAHAFFSGQGYGELYINGSKVSDHVLDPAFTLLKERALYVCHDITEFLYAGDNAAGIILGNARWGAIACILQLNIECEDGSKHHIVSDLSWKTARGPIIEEHLYHGEVYDAREEIPGWDRPGLDDSGWKPVSEPTLEIGQLSAQLMPPIRKTQEITPVAVQSPEPDTYIFDMGQNFSGWTKLTVKGPAGTLVSMRHAELIFEDGTLNQATVKGTRSTDTYILKGEGVEEFEPRFTYHGFRYVELRGFPGTPTLDSVRGCVVHTDVPSIGHFKCDVPLLNSIQHMVVWGLKTNLHSIPTDCCNRYERQGWMGDAHITADTAMKNFDMTPFYENFLRDIVDEQDDSGAVPDTVPRYCVGQRPADPLWGAAYPIIAWHLYVHTGDKYIIENHYDSLKRFLDSEQDRTEDHILTAGQYGDWVALVKSDQHFLSTAFYLISIRMMKDMANAIGKKEDVKELETLSEAVSKALHDKYFHPETINYAGGTQTENALALWLDLPGSDRISDDLNCDIVWRNNTHTTCGFIGVKYLFEALDKMGRSDTAYDLAVQTTYPSWGYMVEKGATTFWEIWQHKISPGMNSHNHPMLGNVGNWFYTTLAGIVPDPAHPGFERLRIAPKPLGNLKRVSASISTVRGAVSVEWTRTHGQFSLKAAVPVGSTAEIVLPKFLLRNIQVRESGNVMDIPEDAHDKTSIRLEVGSGSYHFELTGD